MSELIFLLGDGANIERLVPAGFPSEDELQGLVARFPELLSGDQADRPLRLALVKREAGIPDGEGAADRWSLDHLFIDADAVPTIVEVKRASDTRLRREVVGQILDYAANGSSYWRVEDVRRWFEDECAKEDLSEAGALQQLAGRSLEPDEFWSRFSDNLSVGRVRLVVVADQIPAELERIIEFLNAQMSRAEVLGIELRQFAAGDRRTLVPRIVGGAASAGSGKSAGPVRSFAERLETAPESVREVADRLAGLALTLGLQPRETKAARVYENQLRRGVALYPSWECVEFSVGPILEQLGHAALEPLLSSMTSINGRAVTLRSPLLRCDDLLRHWGTFANEVLPFYLEAWARADAES